MSGSEFDDGVTVSVDEALLARIRAEAARRRAGGAGGVGSGGVGSGGVGGVAGSAGEVTEHVGVVGSGGVDDGGGVVPEVEGFGALREIGRGGFSRVYEALQFEFQRWVAVKVLNEALEGDEEIASFERECRLMGVLSRHPNIVTVFASAFTSEQRPCIVMELFPYGSFLNVLQSSGPLGFGELLPLTVQMSGALATAHRQGVVHGDVKPQNVFRSEFGAAALGDFGIATLMHQRASLAKTRLSLYYAAPELIEGGVSAISPFADQYSLAATTYTLATGLRPFASDTGDTTAQLLSRMVSEPAPRLGPEFPESLDEALWRAMAREPQHRHRDMVAFAAAIAEVEHELGLKPTEVPVTRDAGRYLGQTPGPDRPRTTTGSRSQDSPVIPPARTADTSPTTASRDHEEAAHSQTVVRPMTPVTTGSPEPPPQQSHKKRRIPLWAKISLAAAAIAATSAVVLLVVNRGNDTVILRGEIFSTLSGGESTSEGVSGNGDATPGDAGDKDGETSEDPGDDGIDAKGVIDDGSSSSVEGIGQGNVESEGLIVFSAHRGGFAEMFAVSVDGSSVQQLTENMENDWAYGWIPADERIVFSSDRDGDSEVYVMDTDGTNVQQLTDNSAEDSAYGAVGEGQRIIFFSDRDGDSEVYVMDADGENVQQLTHNNVEDWAYGAVGEGERILFTSNRDGDLEIYVMDADGENVQQLTHNNADDSAWDWSPSGEQIGFESDRDGDLELYVMDADGTSVQQLTHNEDIDWWLGWSPDGTRIAFSTDTDGDYLSDTVRVMNADGSNVSQVIMLPDTTTQSASDAIDESTGPPEPEPYRIAFVSNWEGEQAIYYVDFMVHTNDIEILNDWHRLTTNDRKEGSPSWSPDGRWIAFQRQAEEGEYWQIFVRSIESPAEHQLLCGTDNGWSPDWSPGGTSIAFARGSEGENDLLYVDVDTLDQGVLKDKSGKTDRRPRWSPDGNHIAFVRGNFPDRQVWVLHVHSEDRDIDEVPKHDGDHSGPDWSPVSDTLAFAVRPKGSEYRHIYTADLRISNPYSNDPQVIVGNRLQITDDVYRDDEPTWSPDGKWIAFTREDQGDKGIYVVNSSGGEPQALAIRPGFDYWAPSWAPIGAMEVDPTLDCRS